MNDTASFLVYRSASADNGPERTYTAIWFEELREWRIYLTGSDPQAMELWSTEGWDTKRALMLAFEDCHITYSEAPPC